MATGPEDRGTTQQLPYKSYAMCNGADSTQVWAGWSSETSLAETTWSTWTISCQSEYTEAVPPYDSNSEGNGDGVLLQSSGREATPEEIEQREARQREEQAQREKEQKKEAIQMKKAERKAKKLLFGLIGKTDYRKFMHSGYLDVEGKSGRVYRIKPREQLTEVFEGKDKLDVKLESLCIVTRDCRLPEADEMLWKKLMIETNEEEFVEVACVV